LGGFLQGASAPDDSNGKRAEFQWSHNDFQARTMYEAHFQRPTLPRRQSPSRRRVCVSAAIQGGLVAGAVTLLLLQFFSIVVYDESPWKLLRMIAATVYGRGALEPDDEFDAAMVTTAVMLFMTLAVLYSLAFSAIMSDSPRRYSALIGIAFGVALYHVNFYGFTFLFPWFKSLRTVDMLIVHAFFGLLIAKANWLFRRRLT
jgi:hypothetical protein